MKVNFLVTMIILVISHIGKAQANSYLGAIETPEIQVFYEGIPTQLYVQAIGEYTDVQLNIPNPYVAAIGTAGTAVIVTCTGVNKKGKRVQLKGSKQFLVKKAPKPNLYLDGFSDGSMVSLLNGELKVSYDDNVPFSNAINNFSAISYCIMVTNLKGTLEGTGSRISENHIQTLKNLPIGSRISVLVKYTGTMNGLLSAIFEL